MNTKNFIDVAILIFVSIATGQAIDAGNMTVAKIGLFALTFKGLELAILGNVCVPDTSSIPIEWIEKRIRNAEETGFPATGHIWKELIDGYRRECEENKKP